MNEIKRLQQLAGIITEIRVNKPGNIPFEDLEIGRKYNLTWNDGGSEENEDIKIVDFDSDDTENWAMIDILTDRDKWEEKTGSEPGEHVIIQLFPEDIISIRPA